MTIERIEKDGKLLAIVIKKDFKKEGINFVTEDSHSFQLGFLQSKKGHRYKAHICLPFENIAHLNVNKFYHQLEGKMGIDIYDDNEEKVTYITLNPGDSILFTSGGHGCDVLEDERHIELKQGPYRGFEKDKRWIEKI